MEKVARDGGSSKEGRVVLVFYVLVFEIRFGGEVHPLQFGWCD